MTQKITFKVLSYNESPVARGKLIDVQVRASDLERVKLPTDGNVRNASNNRVVKSIVESIEESPHYMIYAPLVLTCKSAEKVRDRSGNNYYLELVFAPGHGVIDGLHRLKGIESAKLRGLDLDNVFLFLKVCAGIPLEEARKISAALNTSQNPTQSDLLNHQGEYEYLKDLLAGYPIRYYSNQPGVPQDPFCSVAKVSALPLLVSRRYDRNSIIPKYRHPVSGTRAGFDKASQREEAKKTAYLIPDLLEAQAYLAKLIEKTHHGRPLPFVTIPKNPQRLSHFPVKGSPLVLSIRVPANCYTAPMISALRPWIDDDMQWILPFDSFYKQLIDKLWRRYLSFITPARLRGYGTAESMAGNPEMWDWLYDYSAQYLKDFESELKKKALKLIA